jgi:HlyD family secretion protein
MRLPRLCIGGSLALLTAWLSGCSRPDPASQVPQSSGSQIPTVTTAHPEKKSIVRVVEQPAFVEAFEETPLFARITGYIQKVPHDMGDRVKGPTFDAAGKQVEAGDMLAELWVPEMEEDLRQKQALVVQAKAEADQAAAAVDAADAAVATAKALVAEAEAGRERALATFERWESEYQRMVALAKSKVIDEQTRDETRNQFKAAGAARKEVEAKVGSAQATARESEAKRDKAKADLAAAKARIQVAQAEEGRAAALLDYSKIRAPYDGVITSRNVATGYYLTGMGAKPLFVVARMDVVRIMVDVPEADASVIRENVPAHVRFPTMKEHEQDAKVTRTSWSLDAKARTLRAEIDLPNPQGKLRPGMYAYVSFKAESPPGFTLPAAAVMTQGDQSSCFRLENDKAVRMPIKTGARDSQIVQVLQKQTKAAGKQGEPAVWENFTGQEEIIAGGAAALTDGQAVSRKE